MMRREDVNLLSRDWEFSRIRVKPKQFLDILGNAVNIINFIKYLILKRSFYYLCLPIAFEAFEMPLCLLCFELTT